MLTDLASDFNVLMNLEQGILRAIEKFMNICSPYINIKDTIMIEIQQSSLGHFLFPAGSYHFFKPETPSNENKKPTNKHNGNFEHSGRKRVASGEK